MDVAIDYDNSNQTLAGKVCGETQIKTQLRALFVTSPEVILLNMTFLFTLSHQLSLSLTAIIRFTPSSEESLVACFFTLFPEKVRRSDPAFTFFFLPEQLRKVCASADGGMRQ